MIQFYDLNYNALSQEVANELFILRKKTFKDRLDWIVDCEKNEEFDRYDNQDTTYIFGISENRIICSVRFIETKLPNMITDIFKPYFKRLQLPEGNDIEASRLFIDKERIKSSNLRKLPISLLLFLSMINYAKKTNYKGIYAIVSHAMLTIFQKSGWQVSVVDTGISEKCEHIHLIYMPVDVYNQHILMNQIRRKTQSMGFTLSTWPLSFCIKGDGFDKFQLDTKPYSVLGIGNP